MQDFWMAITSTSRISTLPQPGTKGTKRKVTDLEEEAVDLAAEEDPFGGYQAVRSYGFARKMVNLTGTVITGYGYP
jgi:hypothetical protein